MHYHFMNLYIFFKKSKKNPNDCWMFLFLKVDTGVEIKYEYHCVICLCLVGYRIAILCTSLLSCFALYKLEQFAFWKELKCAASIWSLQTIRVWTHHFQLSNIWIQWPRCGLAAGGGTHDIGFTFTSSTWQTNVYGFVLFYSIVCNNQNK